MARTFDLSVVFKVIDQASGKFDRIGTAVQNMTVKLNAASQRLNGLGMRMKAFGQKASQLGKTMSTRLSLPIVAFGGLMLNMVNKFEKSMNKVSAVSGATGEDLKKLRERAKEMGSTTQFSASEAADAMTFLAMAGLKTEQIYNALPGVLQLAAAGGLDLASAADIATNVMTSMSKKVSDLGHINNVLAYTANNANTDVRQLAEALRPVGSTADNLNVSLEETAAMLAKMADAGEKGSIAGTFLRNAMLAVVNTTPKSKAAFERMGIDISKFVDESGKLTDFTGLMEEVRDKGATVGDIYKAFGQRGARAVLLLTKKGKDLRKFTKELEDSGGAAEKAAKAMMKGLPGAIKELQSKFEAFILTISESGIGEVFESIIRGISRLLERMAAFVKNNPQIAKFIGLIIAAVAAIGPLIAILGMLSVALGAVSAAGIVVFAAIAAIAYLAYLIIKNWEPIKKFFITIWKDIADYFLFVKNVLVASFNIIGGVFKKVWDGVKGFFMSFINWWRDLFNRQTEWIKEKLGFDPLEVLSKAWGGVVDFFSGIGEGIKSIWTSVVSFFSGIWDAILDDMPDGLKKLFGIGGERAKVGPIKVETKEQRGIAKHLGLGVMGKDQKGFFDFLGLRSVVADMSGVQKQNKDQKSESDVKIKVEMPDQLTGRIVGKKQKGEGTKLTVKLNNTFSGPTLAGVQ